MLVGVFLNIFFLPG
jgi:hypothetical protein